MAPRPPTRSPDVVWHATRVGREDRERALGQGGAVLWYTGLSGAGKSTVANLVEHGLHARGRHVYLLDGDNLRHGLNADLGFSPADRAENVRRVVEVAALLADAGLIVSVAVISPYRRDRDQARARTEATVGAGRFVEIFVDSPLSVCESRDPKGLYRRARAGDLRGMTGIDAPYEPPSAPEIHLRAGDLEPPTLAEQVLAHLAAHGLA